MPGVRTRFAPSPTGHLHIGNVRTALFNWLFARHFNGEFVLRMEDTDTARSDAAFEDSIIEDLSWLGLEWDEGPGGPRGGWGGWGAGSNGPHGPYRQSERLAIYDRHAAALLDKGLAYRCYCSKERLEALKAEQMKKGSPPRYDNRCRSLSPSEIPAGAAPLIRFMVRGRSVRFKDGVHGRMAFDTSAMGDFVIIGSDGVASYNFAVVVDDSEMGITHVLRGDDHLSNTPRQILLFEALGRTVPHYHHLPLVLSPSRSPLGKRDRGLPCAGSGRGGSSPAR
ncbi:MAG: glutamate--tRNA ligase [Thermodesulfobacteriota bacterium]